MIDLPSGPRPSGQTGASTPIADIRPADLARAQVSQTIAAVVLESKLQQQAETQQKPVYDILLKASATPSSNPPLSTSSTAQNQPPSVPLTQITTHTLSLLRQGQSVLIKTAAEFPLQPGAQLLATISPTRGVVLHQILPPQLAASINQALKQLVPQQQSMSPLFRNLELLTGSSQGARAGSLTPQIQGQLNALLQLLPRLEQLKTAAQVRSALTNSGLFLESRIQQALNAATATSPGQIAKGESTESQLRNSNPPLSQGLKELTQRVKDAVTSRTAVRPDNATQSGNVDLQSILKGDLKQQLLGLQARLEQAQTTQKAVATGATTPQAIPPGSDSISGPGGKGQDGKIVDGKVLAEQDSAGKNMAARSTDGKMPDGKASENYPPIRARNSAQQDSAFVPRPAPNKSHAYSSSPSGAGNYSDPNIKTAIETYLLPPLPGNIALQPQGRTRLAAQKDMADALVSVLLKQVKGALSRITLHQLASQPRSQEPGSPAPLLSFELPILYQGQVQIFQFLIEEEDSANEREEKQQAKRWVVQMAFDIEGLGPMLCQISLVGNSASVSFWAEWENTLQHTKDHFDYLQQVLTEMGLRVEKLQGHLGIPKSEQAILQNQLVDIRT